MWYRRVLAIDALLIALFVLGPVPLAWAQAAAGVAPSNPFTLWAPVIIAAVPIVVSLVKKLVPDNVRALVPVIAVIVGPILEFVVSWLTGKAADPGAGAMYGAMGVVLREVVDQTKKAWTA